MEFKENQVYKWKWTDKKIETFKKHNIWSDFGDNYHCKDRQFIVKMKNSELYLVDTYWTSEPFQVKCADEKISNMDIDFYIDLNDYKQLKDIYEYRRCQNDYNDDDLLMLFCQSGYSNTYYIKLGAKESTEHKIKIFEEKILEAENKIKYLNSDISNYKERIEAIK